MAAHACSFQVQRSRVPSVSHDPQPRATYTNHAALILAGGLSTTPFPEGLVPLPAWWGSDSQVGSSTIPLAHVFGFTSIAAEFTTPIAVEAERLSALWTVDGAATGNTALPFIPFSPATYGRLAPGCGLQFAGAVLAALTDEGDPPIRFQGVGHFSLDVVYTSDELFVEFQDEPPETSVNSLGRALRLAQDITFTKDNFVLGITSGGVVRKLNQCGFAALTPEARIWIRPEDQGSNNEQIPTAVTNNTAGHFRFFPGVFFRRGDYVHSVSRVVRDEESISAGSVAQPVRITIVDAAPVSSTWLVVVDGTSHIIVLPHPVGSDFRRPDEIWNGIWVPLLYSAAGGPIGLANIVPFLDPTTGALVGLLDKLGYLQYARCLSVNADSLIDFPQTGTSPG